MLWIQDNGHILYVEVFTLVVLHANVELQTKEGTHGYWSYPMPEQFCACSSTAIRSKCSVFFHSCRVVIVFSTCVSCCRTSPTPTPHKCRHSLWCLRKLWSKCYVGPCIMVSFCCCVFLLPGIITGTISWCFHRRPKSESNVYEI